MSTVILRPSGAGGLTELTPVGEASNYLCVDEATSDGDTTRVSQPSFNYLDPKRDLYATTHSIPADVTINSVTVYAKARNNEVDPGEFALGVDDASGAARWSADKATTTSYADYSQVWTTRAAGGAWQHADMDSLEIGVRTNGDDGSGFYNYITQVWCVVDYTPPVGIDVNINATVLSTTFSMPTSLVSIDKTVSVSVLAATFSIPVAIAKGNVGLANYNYSKDIGFDTSAVTGIDIATNQANVPVCVHIDSSSWPIATERDAFFCSANANGKRVQFYDADGTTNLPYEVEKYNEDTQEAIYWVMVTQIDGNSSTDKMVVGYGNDPLGVNQDNPTDVWDSGHKGVIHSPSYPWKREGTVLSASQAWEGGNVYEPSVLYDSPTWKMWYTGGWVNRNIGYAESIDGKIWTKHASNPIVSNASRSFVFIDNSIYYMFCANADDTAINLLTSEDGISWTPHASNPMLSLGTGGDWDNNHLANISVYNDNGSWKMLYEASGNGSGWRIGLATANSPSGTWTKYSGNPVISKEPSAVGGPSLTKIGSYYYLWHHQGLNSGLPTDLNRMRSVDLITWENYPDYRTSIREGADEGEQTSVGQMADPDIFEVAGRAVLYYAASSDGGDENAGQHIKLLSSQIPISEILNTFEEIPYDSTINAYHGTPDGSSRTPAMVSDGRSFDGVDDHIDLPSGLQLGTGQFTIECWIKTADTGVAGFVSNMHNSGAYEGASIYLDADNKLKLRCAGTSSGAEIQGNSTINDNTWHYVVGRRSAAGALKLFVDGVAQSSSGTNTDDVSYANYVIGTTYPAAPTTSPLNGLIDEVRISSIDRSDDWIKLVYYSIKKTNWHGDSWITWGDQVTNATNTTISPDVLSMTASLPSATVAISTLKKIIIKYNIAEFAGNELILKYNIRQLASKDLVVKYNIRNLVGKAVRFVYNIFESLLGRSVEPIVAKAIQPIRARAIDSIKAKAISVIKARKG
jgi:hypothetical protein